ncbi:DNA polymerase III PolC-type [Bacillus paralicheniformis]|uniref:exonuclease domain-containing protein n=1 Tax=Bacillus paralicheniformis TaxID=1648923 RepID=UPI0011A65BE0|nr:exonuclease domain-containing protein [Bacillus paralicheniformis]TWJ39620.1 DNA polymerase III PolC-type [Bacillus paralicheniformis]
MLLKKGINSVVFIDFETNGLNPDECYPTEIAIKEVLIDNQRGRWIDRYDTLIQLPEGEEIPEKITELTGLTTDLVNTQGKPIKLVQNEIIDFFKANTLVVAQNANFDLGFLRFHFGISPKQFICTKTVEAVAFPENSNSLAKMHKHYYPDSDIEQYHRAAGDVEMLSEVFDAQLKAIDEEGMMFFINRIAILPERPLVFYPLYAKYMDFTNKYVPKSRYDALEVRAEDYARDSAFLSCLEAAGVDNWSGYSYAWEMYEEETD